MVVCLHRMALAIGVALLFALPSLAVERPVVFPGKDWQEATPESQGIDGARLEEAMAYIEEISKEQGNRQSLVIRNGYLIWKGPEIDAKHSVWSCTKSFTSTVLGLMVGDGRCDLDEPLARYVSALEMDHPTATIRHFASFTSGYDHAKGDPLRPVRPRHPPGEMFRYSKATDMLALGLTRMAGESMADLFERRVATPIGMNPKAWSWGRLADDGGLTVNGGAGRPPSGVEITAREMARLGWLYLNKGRWKGEQIIAEAYVEEATRPQSAPDTPPYSYKAWYVALPGAYGLNWWVNGVNSTGRRLWPLAPAGTFAAQGMMNNYCFVVPEWKMVVVRLGTDGSIDSGLYDGFFARMRKALVD
jgi:CubicO group peptidase (beta-lactamase class C family)